MKWHAQHDQSRLRFEILTEEFFTRDGKENIIYYTLYVYNGDQCTHDYQQETLEAAQNTAKEFFNVPDAAWTIVSP
ncbi:MAG: hypothetical protein EBZ69_10115 [Alphaproteobacteria bacterium]|nr:hypothetical protein [Alphaproteobacteria bacterium]